MIAPASLAGVHVYFPDPWPKKRHHKRRLLQAAVRARARAAPRARRLPACRDRLGGLRARRSSRRFGRAAARRTRRTASRRGRPWRPQTQVRGARPASSATRCSTCCSARADQRRSARRGVERPRAPSASAIRRVIALRATSREKWRADVLAPAGGEPFPQRLVVVQRARSRRRTPRRRRRPARPRPATRCMPSTDGDGRDDRQAVAHREVDLALDAGAVAQRRDRDAAAGEVRRRRRARSR